jgi:hypothetical protein
MAPVPIDKYGKPIYSKPFAEIIKNGNNLNKNGYSESYNKPNLYYRKIPEGMLFADMRSSEVIPIWEDTRPLFYWKFNDEVTMWKRRRIIKNEMLKLHAGSCPCRLSFYSHETEEFISTSDCPGYINVDEGIFEWQDGYCLFCGKDLESDEPFCDENCRKEYQDSFKDSCKICNKKLDWKEDVGHHLNYAEDVQIIVCKSCHAKIHLTNNPEFEDYKPVDKRPKHKRKYMLVNCSLCDGKTRVLIEKYNEDEKYFCYRHKSRKPSFDYAVIEDAERRLRERYAKKKEASYYKNSLRNMAENKKKDWELKHSSSKKYH